MDWTPDVIKDLRKSSGHTQQSFATAMGISIETVRSWEQGRKKPSAMARKVLTDWSGQRGGVAA